jgi:hypothetical protein
VKIRPLIAWYDAWIGFYWDRKRKRLYVLPFPCLGFMIEFQGGAGQTPLKARKEL